MAEYEIAAPGWGDIIRLRPDAKITKEEYAAHKTALRKGLPSPLSDWQRETLRRKRERYLRLAKSPTPLAQQKFTQIMTYVDNAEDLLSTALWLGKPLLKKLPLKAIPYVGWVILADDVLNLAQAALGLMPIGREGKRQLASIFEATNWSKWAATKRAYRFFERSAGLGTYLEAAQSLEFLTGYGLRLGPIYGLIQDTIWGGLRALTGDNVTMSGKPPDIWSEKAIRHGYNATWLPTLTEYLAPEEYAKVVAAQQYAVNEVTELLNAESNMDRQEEVQNQLEPVMQMWDEITIEILKDEGVDPYRPESSFFAEKDEVIEIKVGWTRAENYIADWTKYLKKLYGDTSLGAFVSTSLLEINRSMVSFVTGEPNPFTYMPQWEESVPKSAVERGVLPPVDTTQAELKDWVNSVRWSAEANGHKMPWRNDLINGTVQVFGRWEKTSPWYK